MALSKKDRALLRSLGVFQLIPAGIAALFGFFLIAVLIRHPDAEVGTLLHFLDERAFAWHPGLLRNFLLELGAIHLSLLAGFAFVYMLLRLIEFYGLWKERRWGEIYSALSALVYVPFELESIVKKATVFNGLSLLFNLFVVAFMLLMLKKSRQKEPPREA